MVPRRGAIPRRSGPKQAPNAPARHGPPAMRGGSPLRRGTGASGARPPAERGWSNAQARLRPGPPRRLLSLALARALRSHSPRPAHHQHTDFTDQKNPRKYLIAPNPGNARRNLQPRPHDTSHGLFAARGCRRGSPPLTTNAPTFAVPKSAPDSTRTLRTSADTTVAGLRATGK